MATLPSDTTALISFSIDAERHPISSLSRAPFIDSLNQLLEQAWARGLCSKPPLCAQHILTLGQQGIGPVQFDDRREWLDRLDDLVKSLHSEAWLNPLGRTIAHGQLVRAVRQRLKLERLWQHCPEILAMPVPSPIIVLGHMRSGTTRMQRMLASDSRFSATRFCDSWFPVPPRWFDWRPAKAWTALRFIDWLNPQFRNIHPTSALAVDEEIGWLGLGFSSTPYDAQWRIPSFVAANEKRDAGPTYRLLKRILQTQAWHRGGDALPQVLKVPQFMDDIDALLDVFPKAHIIHVTRNMGEVVGSSCSLVANQMSLQSDYVDPVRLGREWLERTASREFRSRQSLAHSNCPVVRVDYDQMNDDWQNVIHEIYRMLDLPLTTTTLRNMEKRLVLPKLASGPHSYRLEEFGLTAEMVEHKMRDQVDPSLDGRITRQSLRA